MLQVDAKKRITIRELLRDPWMMDGYDVPVKWQSKYHSTEVDSRIISEMAAYKLVSPNRMSECIRRYFITALSFFLSNGSVIVNKNDFSIPCFFFIVIGGIMIILPQRTFFYWNVSTKDSLLG